MIVSMRPIIIFFSLLLLSVLFFMSIEPAYIGYIISQGGNVTKVNINIGSQIPWQGVYGQLSSQGESYIITNYDEDISHDDARLVRCFSTEIFATELSSIDWAVLEAADPNDMDSYIGLAPTSAYSGSQVFTDLRAFNVSGRQMMLYSTHTQGQDGFYYQGILKIGNQLVFVSEPREGESFNGSETDFQFMLPRFMSNTTFYLYQDPWDSQSCGTSLRDNNAPDFSGLADIDGYFNTPMQERFFADDSDDDRLRLTTEPYYSFLNLDFRYAEGRYVADMNFTPREKGVWHTNFILFDGQAQVSQRVEFDIGYCGDNDSGGRPRCQSRFEDCETCSQDCGSCSDSKDSFILIPNQTACVGEAFEFRAYDRYRPGECEPATIQGIEVCSPLSSFSVKLFRLENKNWVELDTMQSSGGAVAFTPGDTEYLLEGERSGYYTSYYYVDPKVCPKQIVSAPGITGETIKEVITEEPKAKVTPDAVSEKWAPRPWQLIMYNIIVFVIATAALFKIKRHK